MLYEVITSFQFTAGTGQGPATRLACHFIDRLALSGALFHDRVLDRSRLVEHVGLRFPHVVAGRGRIVPGIGGTASVAAGRQHVITSYSIHYTKLYDI